MKTKRVRGNVGKIRRGKLSGWAMNVDTNEPVDLQLIINGVVIQEMRAIKFRKDVLDKGLHSTGKCGFEFDLGKVLPDQCEIEVRPNNQSIVLNNQIQVVNKNLKNKILVLGLAKSGTSILTYKIANALENSKVYFEPNGHDGIKNLAFHLGIFKKEEAVNIITKLIYHPGKVSGKDLRNLSNLYSKKVWIIRDPRDTILSSFFYRWNRSHNMKKKDFDEALRRTILKEKAPAQVSFSELIEGFINIEHYIARAYGNLVQSINNLPLTWEIVKYEDLVDNKLDQLNDYLNFKIDKDANVPEKLNRVVRSKQYGNWREWFTIEDVQKFKPLFNPILDALGYDTADWGIKQIDTLDSKKGSEYMSKIYKGI
jgi:hypothetical protein